MATKKQQLKTPEVTLQSIEEILKKNHETTMEEIKQIRKEMSSTRQELLELQNTLKENKQKTENLEAGAAVMKGEIGGSQKAITELTGHMSRMDFERMTYFLRFQNVPESQPEDLRELMGSMLAEYTHKNKDCIMGDIDLIYRINSAYARLNDVPREIHIKFVRRATRDEILRAQRDRPLIYQSNQITILKQIPKKIREIRRKYSFLSKALFNKGVWFKWWMPEGMLVFWDGGRVRIKTVEEAEAFLKKHSSFLEDADVETGGATASPTGGGEDGDTIAKRLRSHK